MKQVTCADYDETTNVDLVRPDTSSATNDCYATQAGIPTAVSTLGLSLALQKIEKTQTVGIWTMFVSSIVLLGCVITTLVVFYHNEMSGWNVSDDITDKNMVLGGYLLAASTALLTVGMSMQMYTHLPRNARLKWMSGPLFSRLNGDFF